MLLALLLTFRVLEFLSYSLVPGTSMESVQVGLLLRALEVVYLEVLQVLVMATRILVLVISHYSIMVQDHIILALVILLFIQIPQDLQIQLWVLLP